MSGFLRFDTADGRTVRASFMMKGAATLVDLVACQLRAEGVEQAVRAFYETRQK